MNLRRLKPNWQPNLVSNLLKYNPNVKKLLLLLILSFFSTQGLAGGCPDGSEPVKSISEDGTYFVFNCSGSNTANSSTSSQKVAKALAGIDIENDPNIDFFKPLMAPYPTDIDYWYGRQWRIADFNNDGHSDIIYIGVIKPNNLIDGGKDLEVGGRWCPNNDCTGTYRKPSLYLGDADGNLTYSSWLLVDNREIPGLEGPNQILIADYNNDGVINVLDIVLLIEMILNPVDSIQINSGTSYGECWGYCVFELELDNSSALFKASSWGWDPYGELPDLILEDNLNQIVWQQLVDLIDFEYFQSLDDVYGCPDCADGGAEFIEIIYDGVVKLVTFDAYTEIDGIQELTLFLRDLRTDYWNQINPNQECYIVPEVGPCDGICPTFYYNQSTNECEEFITGCCGVEVFSTLQECQNICE